MGQVTHEQVNLMLRLYELRREARLREAREWYVANFHVNSAEEMMAKFPMDSAASTNIRMVVSYWDMAADIVNRGLIDEDLSSNTTESSGWYGTAFAPSSRRGALG